MSEGSTVHPALAWAPGAALVTFDRPDAVNDIDARMLTDPETVIVRLETGVGSTAVGSCGPAGLTTGRTRA